MKVLVTGITGFIGQELIKSDIDFRCVMRQGQASKYNDVFLIEHLDKNTCWQGGLDNISAVIHLAGLAHKKNISYEEFYSVNTEGTLRLAEEAAKAGVKRFIFVSSVGVNGSSTRSIPFGADSVPKPHNYYTKSKYEAELGLKKIAAKTGLEVVIVRPTLVYGARASGNFAMLVKLVKIFPALPFGLSNNKRSFISVHNLVDLLITCVNHPNAPGQIFLASDGEAISTKEFTDQIAKGLRKKVFQLPIPTSFMRLVGKLIGKPALIEQLFGNLEVDSSNINQLLDWEPPYNIEQAMALLKDSDK